MAGGKDEREESESPANTLMGAISAIPLWMWGLAGVLAVAPAVGFHLIVAPIAANPQASFIFFYWMAALYVSVRKAASLKEVIRRVILLLAFEAGLFLIIRGARLLGM